jgi:hypothetical protein
MFKFQISYKHNPTRGAKWGGGVETCQRGGGLVDEADSVQVGWWWRVSGTGGVEGVGGGG